MTNGGAIPDQFDYEVVLLPSELPVGTLNEDFAFESMPGDVFQLGNASYRIQKVESGKVYVADAHGQPPTIPFWLGEAPGRSDELSTSVGRLNETLAELLDRGGPEGALRWLVDELGLGESAAKQLVDYLAAAKAALGVLPTTKRVIFERFFDETGDTHLVVHSPFGSRINRAWGLSLRKRFCRRFNFELQAAALEDSIVLSLGAVHSFALDEVARYLSSKSVRDVLTQAILDAPLFGMYWRWNASTALAVRRFRNGKKQPAQFQRMDAEDLLSTVFPDQLACAENLAGGDREIPDHPLVKQTLEDCLTAAMDVEGLVKVLERIEAGEIEVICRELTSPSPLAQEILGAKPYAFLDDAPAEERRTLAVQARRYMTPEQAAELGKLDPEAIERVRSEAWPSVLNADELHDALVLLGFVTAGEGAVWSPLFERLRADGRATVVELPRAGAVWVSAERLPEVELALPGAVAAEKLAVLGDAGAVDRDVALRELVRSRFEALGPVTSEVLARPFGLGAGDVLPALYALEQQGTAMRGNFTSSRGVGPGRGMVRAAAARAHSPLHAEAPAQRDRARNARRLSAVLVPLAGPRRRAPPGARSAQRRARRAARLGVAGRPLGARGPTGAHCGLRCAIARSAVHGRRSRLVAAAAERRATGRPRDDRSDVVDRDRAARHVAAVARARLARAGARDVGCSRAHRRRAARPRRPILHRDRAGERSVARAGRGGARRARRARPGDCRFVHGSASRADAAEPAARLPRPQPLARQQRFRRRGALGAAAGAHGARARARIRKRSTMSRKRCCAATASCAGACSRASPWLRAGASSCRSTARRKRAARFAAAGSSSRSAASSSRSSRPSRSSASCGANRTATSGRCSRRPIPRACSG